MENKYYTPDITEFHIGFDYEVKYKNDEWKKECLNDELSSLRFIDFKLKKEPDSIRVKYLDREDIESLGFKFNGDLFYKNNIKLQLHDNNLISITYLNSLNNEYRTFVEQLTIKNKSELKRLLKQLNIL